MPRLGQLKHDIPAKRFQQDRFRSQARIPEIPGKHALVSIFIFKLEGYA